MNLDPMLLFSQNLIHDSTTAWTACAPSWPLLLYPQHLADQLSRMAHTLNRTIFFKGKMLGKNPWPNGDCSKKTSPSLEHVSKKGNWGDPIFIPTLFLYPLYTKVYKNDYINGPIFSIYFPYDWSRIMPVLTHLLGQPDPKCVMIWYVRRAQKATSCALPAYWKPWRYGTTLKNRWRGWIPARFWKMAWKIRPDAWTYLANDVFVKEER